MKIPKISGTTINTELVSAVSQSQLTVLSNILQSFLNYDVVFKYGNTANFDKRLFYTFSNKSVHFSVPLPLGGWMEYGQLKLVSHFSITYF